MQLNFLFARSLIYGKKCLQFKNCKIALDFLFQFFELSSDSMVVFFFLGKKICNGFVLNFQFLFPFQSPFMVGMCVEISHFLSSLKVQALI